MTAHDASKMNHGWLHADKPCAVYEGVNEFEMGSCRGGL